MQEGNKDMMPRLRPDLDQGPGTKVFTFPIKEQELTSTLEGGRA